MGYNKKFLIKNYIAKRNMSTALTLPSNPFMGDRGRVRAINNIFKDNHNNEISLKFIQWFAGLTDGDGYI